MAIALIFAVPVAVGAAGLTLILLLLAAAVAVLGIGTTMVKTAVPPICRLAVAAITPVASAIGLAVLCGLRRAYPSSVFPSLHCRMPG